MGLGYWMMRLVRKDEAQWQGATKRIVVRPRLSAMRMLGAILLGWLLAAAYPRHATADEGTIALKINPEDAEIWIDGKLVASSSPVVLRVEEGRHRVEVRLPNSQTQTLDLIIPANTTVSKTVTIGESQVGGGAVFKDCETCPEMVEIPAGRFVMGSPDGAEPREEHPEHEVSIAYRLAVGKYEVTFDEWDACVQDGGCDGYKPKDEWGRGRRPVIYVSWIDARSYVQWLTKKTGKPYRLLTESEWEYAARGNTKSAYSWGNDIGRERANCNGCGSVWDYKQAAPVGSFPPNSFGLNDMHGNVWEWVEDCYTEDYSNAPNDGRAATTGCDSDRVLRGGSYLLAPFGVRSAKRGRFPLGDRNYGLGFRVSRTLVP